MDGVSREVVIQILKHIPSDDARYLISCAIAELNRQIEVSEDDILRNYGTNLQDAIQALNEKNS